MPKATKATRNAAANEAAIIEAEKQGERFYKAEPERRIETAIGVGVAKSYDIPAVAAARKVRRGVYVSLLDGKGKPIGEAKHYESTYKAFLGEKIPHSVGQVIAFRGRLRKPENAEGLPFRTPDGAVYFFRDAERLLAEPEAKK